MKAYGKRVISVILTAAMLLTMSPNVWAESADGNSVNKTVQSGERIVNSEGAMTAAITVTPEVTAAPESTATPADAVTAGITETPTVTETSAASSAASNVTQAPAVTTTPKTAESQTHSSTTSSTKVPDSTTSNSTVSASAKTDTSKEAKADTSQSTNEGALSNTPLPMTALPLGGATTGSLPKGFFTSVELLDENNKPLGDNISKDAKVIVKMLYTMPSSPAITPDTSYTFTMPEQFDLPASTTYKITGDNNLVIGTFTTGVTGKENTITLNFNQNAKTNGYLNADTKGMIYWSGSFDSSKIDNRDSNR